MSENGVARSVWWRAWLLVLAACGLFTATVNLIEPFDTAPEAAALINHMGLREKTWVSFPRSHGQAIAAVDGIAMERLAQHCSEDFIRWNSPDDNRITSIAALNLRLQRKVDDDGRFYLVSAYRLPPNPPLTREIGIVRSGYDGQDYYLYIVGHDHAEARPHNRPCNGQYLPLRHA